MKYQDPILMNMSNAEYHAKEDISASDLKSCLLYTSDAADDP